MMKKNNKILVGALALLLVMTVGYALFSDTLTINGTATAQGNFNLRYECTDKDESGGTGTCTVSGNTITTTSTLTKPGDEIVYLITITNTGTIPAILKTADSPNNYKEWNPSVEEPTSGDELYIDNVTLLSAYYAVCRDPLGDCQQITGDSAIEASNIILQPNESLGVIVYNLWGDSSVFGLEQPKPPEEGFKMTYNITLGFEQITAE